MALPESGPLALTDIQTEFGGSNPIGMNEYYAGGGLVPSGTTGTYGAVPSSGALSVQNFYGTSAVIPAYIEEVFSTYLYTGNGSTQTITNGIDLAGEGGLVWIKNRSNAGSHLLFDTARGADNLLQTNQTNAQNNSVGYMTTFNAAGFGLASSVVSNASSQTYASWTFRKQPKFFDVVTWTGDGSLPRSIPHNLESVPGSFIIKRTDATGVWLVYHRSIPSNSLVLNSTAALDSASFGAVTSTYFELSPDVGFNGAGATYVAYLFAHDAGGFGLSGEDNVISCGSVSGFGTVVNLGYEPQWILMKRSDGTGDWIIADNMRGIATGGNDALLFANTSGAETSANDWIDLTSTGFVNGAGSGTYIYIAIRRGPMKVPESGTEVFAPTSTSVSTNPLTVTTNFPVDLTIGRYADSAFGSTLLDRLRGGTTTSANYLQFDTTSGETIGSGFGVGFQNNTAIVDNGMFAGSTAKKIYWNFQRAPSFFDEVCYTGTGTAGQTYSHNLGVPPELIIIQKRLGNNWAVYSAPVGNTQYLYINSAAAASSSLSQWNNTSPTSSVFTLGATTPVNLAASTYVAYLFASAPGVSKVGSYTGNGSSQTINCGFTAGARLVLIKRTDSTGDWYVWDSARGIVAGNDPYLLLNSTAAEVTSTDYVDTYSAGFEITSTAPAAINASGGTFIFLAIA